MTILSDTIYYRGDGTISSIMRKELVTFTGPKGESFSKEVESTVQLEAVAGVIGPACAALEVHNQSLEAQIVTEREVAAADKSDAIQKLTQAMDAAIAEKDATIAAKDAEIAEVAARAEATKQ